MPRMRFEEEAEELWTVCVAALHDVEHGQSSLEKSREHARSILERELSKAYELGRRHGPGR